MCIHNVGIKAILETWGFVPGEDGLIETPGILPKNKRNQEIYGTGLHIYVDERTPEGYATAMEQAYADKQWQKDAGKQLRQHVKRNFSWERTARGLDSLFAHLRGDSSRSFEKMSKSGTIYAAPDRGHSLHHGQMRK